MARHDARIARLERSLGVMAEGPETMVELELTDELRAAILDAESALGVPLSALTKADKGGALWIHKGHGEIGTLGQARSQWGRLATGIVLGA
jgi:hypothetical protein